MHGKAETQKQGNAEMWKAWESRNTETRKCRNVEGVGKQKCGNVEVWKCRRYRKAEKQNILHRCESLASAYVLCPRLTKQCVSFYLKGVRITDLEGT